MNGGQDGLLVVRGDGGYEGDDDRGDVGRDLELEEFSNGVVDAATPHDSLDDRSEVVVHENDVGSLLGDLSAGDTHRKSDVGGLESGAVVYTITGNTDDFAKRAEGFDKYLLIFRRRPSRDL